MPKLFEESNSRVGGAAIQWFSWFKGFSKNGHKISLLTYKGAKSKEKNVKIIESFDLNYGIPKVRVFYYRIPKLLMAIKKYDPDFLIQGGATGYTGLLAIISKILGKPFVHRIANDIDVDNRLKMFYNNLNFYFYQLGLKLSDYIVAQNSYQKETLEKKFPRKKIFILHNPFFIESDIKPNKKSQRHYISWVGNFRYQKNLPALYEITKQLPEVQFKIAGIVFPKIDKKTKIAIENLKTSANVDFVGYLDRTEIRNFIRNSILLLNTARYEGFSNTFLEAWSLGTPIVSTQNVNPDNIIIKYNLGLVGDTYNDLPLKIKKILNLSEAKYSELANHCQNYVKEYHDPIKLAEIFINNILKK